MGRITFLKATTAQWGAYQYNAKADVLVPKVEPVTLSDTKLGHFSRSNSIISATNRRAQPGLGQTVVPIPAAGRCQTGRAQIEAAMASPDKKDAGLYFQAATFYYNHDLDLKKALAWVNAGLEGQPRIAFELLHSEVLAPWPTGDKEGAISAAPPSNPANWRSRRRVPAVRS